MRHLTNCARKSTSSGVKMLKSIRVVWPPPPPKSPALSSALTVEDTSCPPPPSLLNALSSSSPPAPTSSTLPLESRTAKSEESTKERSDSEAERREDSSEYWEAKPGTRKENIETEHHHNHKQAFFTREHRCECWVVWRHRCHCGGDAGLLGGRRRLHQMLSLGKRLRRLSIVFPVIRPPVRPEEVRALLVRLVLDAVVALLVVDVQGAVLILRPAAASALVSSNAPIVVVVRHLVVRSVLVVHLAVVDAVPVLSVLIAVLARGQVVRRRGSLPVPSFDANKSTVKITNESLKKITKLVDSRVGTSPDSDSKTQRLGANFRDSARLGLES